MPGNRRQSGSSAVCSRRFFFRIAFLAVLLSVVSCASARAQQAGGQAKALPAKSKPVAFYTPEGQQQLADAILTETVGDLFDQADEQYDKGEYNHSVNLYRVVVQGNPRRVDAFANAGYLLWSTGQNDAAIAFLKQGAAANSDSYYMYDELGSFFLIRLKDYPNAATYYEQAVKFKDAKFFTWTGLAHSYEKLNQWDKAVSAWEQASNYVGGDGLSAQTARSNSMMIQRNLRRARAELASRQKP
jgi:tetratricopeptide (TPR) repeat protein